MNRRTAFESYFRAQDGISLLSANIDPILKNLTAADTDGQLLAFLLNENPYKSRFAFVAEGQMRGCDQGALVCALNLYGAEHPGFAARLNAAFSTAFKRSAAQAQALNLILLRQLQLQEATASLIDFADEALTSRINGTVRGLKKRQLLKWGGLLCLSATAPIVFTMLGAMIVGFLFSPLILVSLWKTFVWAITPVHKDDAIMRAARPISDNPACDA